MMSGLHTLWGFKISRCVASDGSMSCNAKSRDSISIMYTCTYIDYVHHNQGSRTPWRLDVGCLKLLCWRLRNYYIESLTVWTVCSFVFVSGSSAMPETDRNNLLSRERPAARVTLVSTLQLLIVYTVSYAHLLV